MSHEAARHNLLNAPAVYFSVSQPIDEKLFSALASVLNDASGHTVDGDAIDRHWAALSERLEGRSPWSRVVPMPVVANNDPDRIAKLQAADQSFRNVVTVRQYAVFVVDGLRVTIDVFNPRNELELPGWPPDRSVLALPLAPAPIGGRSPTRDLASCAAFYPLLSRLDALLNPLHVYGTFTLASMVQALHEGRMRTAGTFSQILFPLTVVLHRPEHPTLEALASLCAVAQPWTRNRTLVQVLPGLDPKMTDAYTQVAHRLGLRPWTRYVEGRDPGDGC